MRMVFVVATTLLANTVMCGQAPVSASAECSKNVSFAVTAGGQPVAAIPGFAIHWINEKHQQRYPGLCFAQTPDPRARNYVVVFSTQQDSFNGLIPSVLKYVNSATVSEDSALQTIYGEMWHYSVNQPEVANTTTLNLLHADTSTVLFVRAYNEQGVVVSQVSLKEISGWLHTKEKLLERVLGDIRADSRQATASPVPLKTSLPVYYVNCDVPVKSLAGQEVATTQPPASAPPAPAAQLATLELWSSPAGADVYVDGAFVSRTPSSVTLPAGEHTVTMRKQNFGTWQRKLQFASGRSRVTGHLEQKVVILGFGQQ